MTTRSAITALLILPRSTVMTGTTTQIMIDIADLAQNAPDEKRRVVRVRLARMMASVLAFASGCAAAALFYAKAGIYCFVIPRCWAPPP
jgi:uncharacterized membrane protein YoaK (UPF0700 family)